MAVYSCDSSVEQHAGAGGPEEHKLGPRISRLQVSLRVQPLHLHQQKLMTAELFLIWHRSGNQKLCPSKSFSC